MGTAYTFMMHITMHTFDLRIKNISGFARTTKQAKQL
jgi:hypothetical protein